MKKRFLTMALMLVVSFGGVTQVNAATTTPQLTAEQQAVLDSYESVSVESVSEIKAFSNPATFSTNGTTYSTNATTTSWRGSFYRGSALMWSRDNIQWTVSGGKVTSSTGWQEAGYIFPNIARATGISKHASSTSSVTYRATKTIGAGVVTPWGDVTVYEQDFTDFLKGNTSGTLSTWQ